MVTKVGDMGNSLPELVQIGAFPGAYEWSKFGFGSIKDTPSTIYTPGVDPGLYQYLDVPQICSVASTDPDDTDGGSGANTVIVYGIHADSTEHSEVIQLNGQTPVDLLEPLARVFRIINISKEGHDVQGQLYCGPKAATWTAGEPSQILAHINDGKNQTQMFVFTVPKDYTLLVYNLVLCSHKDKEVTFELYMRQAELTDISESMVFTLKGNWLLYRNVLSISLGNNPFSIPEGTDVEMRGYTVSGTELVTANATGIMIPTKYLK